MKRTRLLLIFIFFITQGALIAQTSNLRWVRTMTGTSDGLAQSMILDPSNNVYTTGRFQGTVDFDPGPSVFNLISAGFNDAFISKMDSAGNFLWAKVIGGSSDEEGSGIAADAWGNVYICGYFNQSVDFDPGVGVFNLTSIGFSDFFILKLDASGNFLWAKTMGGNVLFPESASSLTVGPQGDIYITGYFGGVCDFDPGASVLNLTSNGDVDVFILRLNPAGNLVWARSFGGKSMDRGLCVKADPVGNVYMTGWVQDSTVDFDPGPGTFNVIPSGTDAFISKLDALGNFKWAKTFTPGYTDAGHSLVLDALGNVYTTGHFSFTEDFDPGPGVYNLSAINGDCFISKLDTSGAFVWARKLGIYNGSGASITVDTANDIYTVGNYYNPTANVFSTAFIHKMDKTGNAIWRKDFLSNANIIGKAISLDKRGNMYSAGYFEGTADFDLDQAVYNVTAATTPSNANVFVHKMGPCPQTKAVLSNMANVSCNGNANGTATVSATGGTSFTYLWSPSGGSGPTATGLSPGVYSCLVTNDCGDTELVKINIIQPPAINTFTSLSGATMASSQNGADYQWVNCNGFQPISGATNQSYTATSPGSYAVIITVDSCSDTSACINITTAGVDNQATGNPVAIYPNPNNGQFTIELMTSTQLIITDALGREIIDQRLHAGKNNLDLSTHPDGLYFVKLKRNNGQKTMKILLQRR